MDKRGQLAIYVIIAVLLVGIVAVLLLYPNIRTTITGEEFSPVSYLEKCIQPQIKSEVDRLSMQGGYSNPEGYILDQDIKIKYLCYTANNFDTCVVQQPMIKNHFEKELGSLLIPKAIDCSRELKKEFEKRGFRVSSSSIDSMVSIVPNKIIIQFLSPMTLTKDTSFSYNGFNVEIDSEIYDLLITAQSIVEFESVYGDSETTLYLEYYPDLSIRKIKTDDGSTIYKLENVITKEVFVFASRSLVWPPGYSIE